MQYSQTITLYQLTTLIQQTLDLAFSNSYFWVTAEISSMQIRYGHCYLTLVEKDPDNPEPKVEIKGIIWKTNFEKLNSKFNSITGFDLKAEIKVLVLVAVRYSPRYGLNLYIYDIQGNYTLGQMYLDRKKTIENLKQLGIFEKNKQMSLPLVPQRIAVLSALDSKGFEDFLTTLKRNKFNYSFYVKLYSVLLQGANSGKSIADKIDLANSDTDQFDIIVIVRGGGGNVDLSCFDDFELAKAICMSKIPILTGIGHTTDLTIADLVAAVSCQTPTAAAQWIITQFYLYEQLISKYAQNIAYYSQHFLVNQNQQIERSIKSIIQITYSYIAEQQQKLNLITQSFFQSFNQKIQSEQKWIICSIQFLKYFPHNIIQNQISSLKQVVLKLSNIIEKFFTYENLHLKGLIQLLRLSIIRVCSEQSQRIIHLEKLIEAYDPKNILKKGFTYCKQRNKIIKSVTCVDKTLPLQTIFFDGELISEIKQIKT